MIGVGFAADEIDRAQVLTDRAAVVEAQPGIDCQPIADRHRVARECGSGDEQAAGVGRIAGDGLERRTVAVDVSDTGRDDRRTVVLAPFELSADLPLVIGAPSVRTGNGSPWPWPSCE